MFEVLVGRKAQKFVKTLDKKKRLRITYELFLNKKLIKVRYIGYRGRAYK